MEAQINPEKIAKLHVSYDGIILRSNTPFAKIFGINKNEIVNKSVSLLIPKNIIKSHMETFHFLKNIELDKRIHHMHKMTISMLLNNNMEKVLINVKPLIFYMEVTFKLFNNKETLKKLEQYNTEIESIPRLTHDIRNYLHVSNDGLIQLSEKCSNNKVALDIINSIHQSNLQINNLVSTNIELYKMKSSHDKYDWINVHNFVKDLTGHIKILHNNSEINITVENMINNIEIYIIPFAVRSILSNLIANSFKYTSIGYIKILFSFTEITQVTGYFEFKISDTGPKLPLSVCSFLNEEINYTDVTEIKGTGIGIKIIKELINLINGKITIIADNLSKYIIITIYVRYIVPDIPFYYLKNKSIEFPCILIVDDEKLSLKLLKHMIPKTYIVYFAENGKDALEQLKLFPNISIIFMDINMPVMGGIETTIEIRKQNSNINIICISANSQITDENKKLFNNFMTKPFIKNDLLNILVNINKNDA